MLTNEKFSSMIQVSAHDCCIKANYDRHLIRFHRPKGSEDRTLRGVLGEHCMKKECCDWYTASYSAGKNK
jgi:hypothetical protein